MVQKIKQIGNNSLLYVCEFMDVGTPEELDEDLFGYTFLFAESMPLKKRLQTIKINPKSSYRKYITEQIEKLFDLIIEEGFSAKYAALAIRINVCTTRSFVKTYNNDSQK